MESFLLLVLTVGVVALLLRSLGQAQELRSVVRRLEALERAPAVTTTAPVASAPPVAHAPAAPMPIASPPVPAPTSEPAPSQRVSSPPPAPASAPSQHRARLERVLAEHALSIVGGLFVLVAAVFFVGYAIDQGWIGPQLRIALAALLGATLLGVGWWMGSRLPDDERRGRAIGSLHGVLAGVGSAVLFLAIIGGVRVEHVFGAEVALVLQVLVAAITVEVARRWRSQDLAAFGLVGALAAPILLDSPTDLTTLLLVTIALVGAVVLAAVERWPRLLLVAVVVTTPELLQYTDSAGSSTAVVVASLGWWALLVAGAVAAALRDRLVPRSSIGVLLAAPAAAQVAITSSVDPFAAPLAGLAAAQLVAAAGIWRRAPARALPLVVSLVGAGAVTLAVALGAQFGAAATAWSWALEALALWVLWCLVRDRITGAFCLLLTAAAFVQVAVTWFDAGTRLGTLLLSVAALATCATVARLAAGRLLPAGAAAGVAARRVLEPAAAVGWWLLPALTLDDRLTGLSAALALGAWAGVGSLAAFVATSRLARAELLVLGVLAFVVQVSMFTGDVVADGQSMLVFVPVGVAMLVPLLARTAPPRPDALVLGSALQAAAAIVAFVVLLPPALLRTWQGDALVDVLGYGALVLALAVLVAEAGTRLRLPRDVLRIAWVVAALVALDVLSLTVVGVTSSATGSTGTVEQAPQVALTLTWVAVGIVVLFAGTSQRLRRHAELRVGAYALLGLAAAKLVLFDTADLGTPQRVVTFLLTGLGLLASAAIERRMRGADD